MNYTHIRFFTVRALLAMTVLSSLFIAADEVNAQVVVYRLDFKDTKDGINYRPYLGGFYVAPAIGGTGSLILQRTESDGLIYVTLENFGELFVATDNKTKRFVLSAAAANEVSTTNFLAMGRLDTKFKANGANFELDIKVSRELKGYAMSADSQSDLPFSGGEGDSGIAGIAQFTARLDMLRSDAANDAGVEVEGAVAQITAFLDDIGYEAAETTTATARIPDNSDAGADSTLNPDDSTAPTTTTDQSDETDEADNSTPNPNNGSDLEIAPLVNSSGL